MSALWGDVVEPARYAFKQCEFYVEYHLINKVIIKNVILTFKTKTQRIESNLKG
jgi:hypothetical protein